MSAAMKFRKKPVVIEAVEWDGLASTADMISVPITGEMEWRYADDEGWGDILIHTLEGDHLCRTGDWIIRGIEGEFYPCKPGIFERTYEPVAGQEGDGG